MCVGRRNSDHGLSRAAAQLAVIDHIGPAALCRTGQPAWPSDPLRAWPMRQAANTTDLAKALIEHHEGRRAHPYTDTTGNLTIGVGRNLSDRGLSADEIDLLFANDLVMPVLP